MDDLNAQNTLRDVEGVVKWFDPKKGFGFIVGPEGQDVFIHYTQIAGDGYRILEDGARVRYSAERTDRGWHASSVEVLQEGASEPVRRYSRSIRR